MQAPLSKTPYQYWELYYFSFKQFATDTLIIFTYFFGTHKNMTNSVKKRR